MFKQHVYDRSLSGSLWQKFIDLVGDMIRSIVSSVREVPTIKWALIIAAIAVLLTIVARAVHLARNETRARARIRSPGETDYWKAAADAAAAGKYVEGAHLLYLALIESVANRERLRLHPAKTIGDYTRDLRKSASPALPAFGEFARVYQPIVWGSRDCDLSSYQRLHALAESVRDAA